MRPPAGGCHYHKAGEEREKAAEKYEDRNRIAVGEMLSQQVQDLEEEDSKQAEADRAAGIASRVGGRRPFHRGPCRPPRLGDRGPARLGGAAALTAVRDSSEERWVGKQCVRTGRARGWRDTKKKKNK